MKAAVIGAGPSGFFAAGELLKKIPDCAVHMFEKRAAPYGLVRFGVAPDHPLTRSVIKMFDQTAGHDRFRYFGNVKVGRDVTLEELSKTYHAVIVCSGAERPNRPDISGAHLRGVVDALDLSRWMNGERDAVDVNDFNDVRSAVIVGNGNVALDAARMLVRPASDWVKTDIAPYALEVLMHHRIHKITIAGRRGPEDASFTEKELEELIRLSGWNVLSNKGLPFGLTTGSESFEQTIEFLFHSRVESLTGDDRVSGVTLLDTIKNEPKKVSAELVVFATGHRGEPLGELPFDEAAGVIPNDAGRVESCPGFYVCGWVKRGARGLIGHNRKDAIETVKSLLDDAGVLVRKEVESCDWFAELKSRGVRVVTWEDWLKISEYEVEKGAALGRLRINISCEDAIKMLEARG